MHNYKQNASSIGTETHTEKHFAPASGDSKRRTRNKCVNYCKETKECKIYKIECVGPSNNLCRHYSDNVLSKNKQVFVDAFVCSPTYGVGMIMEVTDKTCKVKFKKGNITRSFWLSEMEEMLV